MLRKKTGKKPPWLVFLVHIRTPVSNQTDVSHESDGQLVWEIKIDDTRTAERTDDSGNVGWSNVFSQMTERNDKKSTTQCSSAQSRHMNCHWPWRWIQTWENNHQAALFPQLLDRHVLLGVFLHDLQKVQEKHFQMCDKCTVCNIRKPEHSFLSMLLSWMTRIRPVANTRTKERSPRSISVDLHTKRWKWKKLLLQFPSYRWEKSNKPSWPSPLPQPVQNPLVSREPVVLSKRTFLPQCRRPETEATSQIVKPLAEFNPFITCHLHTCCEVPKLRLISWLNDKVAAFHLDFRTRRSGHHFGDFSQVDASGQIHLPRVNFQNVQTSLQTSLVSKPQHSRNVPDAHRFTNRSFLQEIYLFIWSGKFDFSVDATWPQQRRVQNVYSVGSHDDLRK